jgi:hypothetical protein
LEFQGREITQEEEIGKEEVKLSIFTNEMILYLKYLKISTRKFLDIIKSFIKIVGNKINLQKSVAFLNTNTDHIEKEHKKTIPFTIASEKSNT